MPYKKHSIIRKRKHRGGEDDDEESVNPMNLSTIEGDEEYNLDDSDFGQDLNLSDLDTSASGETTVEDMSQIIPDFSQNSEMNATPESLHLSDLDDLNLENETSENSIDTTTESEIEGGKRKTAKRRGKGKKTKKTMKKRKSKKTSTKKRGGKRATKKTLKQRKRKHYGGQDDLETSLMLSEKQILPKDENPAY
jgi:hypothetical protein